MQANRLELKKREDTINGMKLRMKPKFDKLRQLQDKNLTLHTVWKFDKRNSTIWDFKNREKYAGTNGFHGNSSPQIVENCILRLTKENELIVDPMVGSGTTIDVCKRFNRRCIGYDVKPYRDDIIKNDSQKIPLKDQSVDMVFNHPPYWNMVHYSKAEENLPDISRAKTLDQFLKMLENVFKECHRILKPNKYICVLLGDLVRNGEFVPLCRMVASMLEKIGFKDAGYAVKVAHGEVSRKKTGVIFAELAYTNNLKVSHDMVMFFKKPSKLITY